MNSKDNPVNQKTCNQAEDARGRKLTPEELEALRKDMQASGEWMKQELKRRRNQRQSTDKN
ncbi:MAG: hypothetical protein R3222_02850 [Balneolaceae bacterium]|nr:hypothetical protein [Balneolaceae bacterium]